MVQRLPTGYALDLADPRAPTHDQWLLMSPAERERVVAMLPARLPFSLVPEGDPHRKAKMSALEALDGFFHGTAPIEDADERITRLGSMVNEVLAHKEEALRHAEELEGKLALEQGLREEAERRLAEALAEIERLKRS